MPEAHSPPARSTAPAPADIARETIRQLALRRLPPTPDNYRQVYGEIAGAPAGPGLDEALAAAITRLPRGTPAQARLARGWEKLLAERHWADLPELLGATEERPPPRHLGPGLRALLRQLDAHQPTLPLARKREALERVLDRWGDSPELGDKLVALARHWASYGAEPGRGVEVAGTAPPAAAEPLRLSMETVEGLREALRLTMKLGLIPRLDGHPDLQEEAQRMLGRLATLTQPAQWQGLARAIKALLLRVELLHSQSEDLRQDLLRLLRLLVANISGLVEDDQWLRGQLATVESVIAGPLDKDMLAAAERSLKDVILRQGALKHSLLQAQESFRQMVAGFIDRMGDMAAAAGQYGGRVDDYAAQLDRAEGVAQIHGIVQNLMQDTRAMQTDIIRARDHLAQEREAAQTARDQVKQLEAELQALSEQVRVDQLTGALNRRGLEEALTQEISRAERTGQPLAIALLAIDDFRALNEAMGETSGDSALQHLAAVVQDTLRPTDQLARYSGEEFLVLLPNTAPADAATAMSRVQRELTRRFFLHNNERLLITFGAGITAFQPGETRETAILRADQAMYKARKTGRNRVEVANGDNGAATLAQ